MFYVYKHKDGQAWVIDMIGKHTDRVAAQEQAKAAKESAYVLTWNSKVPPPAEVAGFTIGDWVRYYPKYK